jgi:hypothetical protein
MGYVTMQLVTNISEEHAVSIFKAEVTACNTTCCHNQKIRVHFNIMLPSKPTYPKGLFTSDFPFKIFSGVP